MRFLAILAALGLAAAASEQSVTWTGWFSDLQCATAKVTSGTIGPNNPDCARTCIQKGTPPAFISEQAKAVFTVKGFPKIVDELGYHVEVTGTVDAPSKTLTITRVVRMEYQGASCSRKPPSKK